MGNPNFDVGNSPMPADFAAAVTPSDSTDLTRKTRALFIGSGGNLSVDMAGDGATVLFSNVLGGTILPIRVQRVRASGGGTTAANIVALY